MYNDMQAMLKELGKKGIPVLIECSHHSWLVSIDGEPAFTAMSAADVNTFLAGMLTATIH